MFLIESRKVLVAEKTFYVKVAKKFTIYNIVVKFYVTPSEKKKMCQIVIEEKAQTRRFTKIFCLNLNYKKNTCEEK